MQDLSIKNIRRQALQDQAVSTLLREERLILNWGTGVGKSRVAIRCIEELMKKEPDCTVLLLVAERAHKKNWTNEFNDYAGPEKAAELLERVTMECYASFKNYNYTKWTIVIADEAHHLRSDMRTQDLETVYADYFLALSATISERGDAQNLLDTLDRTFGYFTTLEYDVNDAIREGVLPEPEINVVKVELSPEMQKEYDRRTSYFEERKKEWLDAKAAAGLVGEAENETTEGLKQRFLHAGGMRKQFMGHVKKGLAKWYVDKLRKENKRFICFCSDVKQVTALGGHQCINSKKTQKENDAIIDAFNAGENDAIFAVGMIKEGQNLKGIQACIIVQLDGKERDFKQKFGRVLRSDSPELYILYIPNSQDEKYLENALSDVDPKHIHGWTKPETQQELQFNSGETIAQAGQAITLLQIGNTTLIGPRNKRHAYYSNEITTLVPEGGRLTVRRGGQVTGSAGGIKATVKGVCVDPDYGWVNCVLDVRGSRYMICMPWRSCWGLMMPLASAKNPKMNEVTIHCSANGPHTSITVEQETRRLPWAGIKIPDDEPSRINLVNNLVYIVNRKCG